MFNPAEITIQCLIHYLQSGFGQLFGDDHPAYKTAIAEIAPPVLRAIAQTDAPYHNLEHTLFVTWVGQEMLQGKHRYEGNLSPRDWLNVVISLLCHDIGYLKGVCQADQPHALRYSTGLASPGDDNSGTSHAQLRPGATDASLTLYHVDRGRQFVQETFAQHPLVDVAAVQQNIEMTRFPVPDAPAYSETTTYPGLCRAADLIGQLSDPRYLQKLPALFQEFVEIGTDQAMGYGHSGELRASYPKFYWTVVYPYIRDSLRYLAVTKTGRQIIASLYTNVYLVELEQQHHEAGGRQGRSPFLPSLDSNPSPDWDVDLLPLQVFR